MTVSVKGIRTLKEEPVYVKADGVPEGTRSAFDADGRYYPAQKHGDGVVIIADLERDAVKELTLSDRQTGAALSADISDRQGYLRIRFDEKIFASYVFSSELVKPYLGPVVSSHGESYTRLDLEAKEHPHHRSVFFGIGDVNGVDFWNEPADRGSQKHINFSDIICGAAFVRFTAGNVWLDSAGTPLIDERRTFTVYNQSENCRYIDTDIIFKASYGDVKFGATKEAGPLGIRINDAMRADTGNGRFVNSYGAENESECWGKSAHWCDYYGELKGKKYGIAVFDTETNERYPTAWHIRNYGLFAANNLFFKGGYGISKNDTAEYKYRICFHEDGFNAADKFVQYATNPYKL